MLNYPKLASVQNFHLPRENQQNQLTFTLYCDFAYIKKFFVFLILYFDSFYTKNFEKILNIYYFKGSSRQKTNSNIISTSFMRTLKNLTKAVFILGITCFLWYFLAISLIGFSNYQRIENQENTVASTLENKNQIDQNELNLLLNNEDVDYKNANIIPFQSTTLSKFFLITDLSKTQFIITYFVLGLISLLFATRLIIETNIYEFFNKGEDGMVVFENNEMMFFHYFSCYTGRILKAVGIAFGLTSLFFFVF